MNNPYATDALKGMRAVVCGASKGIGRATAEMLAACGADVIALSRSAPEISGVRSMSLDLEDAAAIEKTIAGILYYSGGITVAPAEETTIGQVFITWSKQRDPLADV